MLGLVLNLVIHLCFAFLFVCLFGLLDSLGCALVVAMEIVLGCHGNHCKYFLGYFNILNSIFGFVCVFFLCERKLYTSRAYEKSGVSETMLLKIE